jgi:hypothetical protein
MGHTEERESLSIETSTSLHEAYQLKKGEVKWWKLVWVQVILYYKISFAVRHLKPYYAETAVL